MTDKKPTKTRRPVALPSLYRAIEDFCNEHDIAADQSIAMLLDTVQAKWFAGVK